MADDAAIEQVLQIDNLPKSKPGYEQFSHVIGKTSIVALNGEHWKKLRKLFTPAFAQSHVETFIPVILEESMVFVDKLNHIMQTGEITKMNDLTTVCFTLFDVLTSDGSI
jgi:cytochrome P450